MKKNCFFVLGVLILLSLVVFATPVVTSKLSPSVVAAPDVVKFSDDVLEALVRGSMGKPDGDITVAEAEAVTWLNLSNEWQQYVSKVISIKDISGLEYFKNLETLDLSFHAITDITPLAELKKLTSLSLDGNPISDITPLTKLTNLKLLTLSDCAAQDYSPLKNLINLKVLTLNNSTITDLSPLSTLTSLTWLYVKNSPIDDYSPLVNIYPNLQEKDFTIISTLMELEFNYSDELHMAKYTNEYLSVIINHTKWGPPQMEWDANCVRMALVLENGYELNVGYYAEIDAYVFGMIKNGETLMNYVYDDDNLSIGLGDRESTEQTIYTALGDMGPGDVLLAPISIFNDKIRETFNMSANTLYALPYAPPTLLNLGFIAHQENNGFLYEQHDPWYHTVEINNPEWGAWDEGGDVRFFTPISDEYRIVIYYYVNEKKFAVGADDNNSGGASYEFFADTDEHNDIWCSDNTITVEQYFQNAYNNPEIEDIYLYTVELMEQYISDTFGMSIDELYALPVDD